jgi:hypothetical protein
MISPGAVFATFVISPQDVPRGVVVAHLPPSQGKLLGFRDPLLERIRCWSATICAPSTASAEAELP